MLPATIMHPPRRVRRHAWLGALVAAAALASPVAASAASWSAAVKFPAENPKLGSSWTFGGTANSGRTDLSGDYRYTLCLRSLCASGGGRSGKWQPFAGGKFSHTFKLAASDGKDGHSIGEAVGLPLTIQVQVKTKYGTRTFSHNFTVQHK